LVSLFSINQTLQRASQPRIAATIIDDRGGTSGIRSFTARAAEPDRFPKRIWRNKMNLSKPTNVTFIIAVVVVLLGIIAQLVTIPVLSGFAFWLVVIGFVILAAGNLFEGF